MSSILSSGVLMISLEEIKQAGSELPPEVVRTPVFRADSISDETGANVLLKTENLQVTGSYKSRAAFTILNRLSDDQKQRGAAISSSGNFAAAFGYMGKLLNVPTVVVMMQKTSPFKAERTRRFGAEVVFCENYNQARWDTLERLEQARGLATINTWEDANVIRGHGSIGLEIMEQASDADMVIVPVSSGGLIAGIATAVKAVKPAVKVIGVQPEGSQAVYRSYHEGTICEVAEPETICDALVAPRPGAIPFEHVQQYVDDMVLVTDDQVREAVRTLASTAKLVVEPGGAVGIAAMQAGAIDVQGKTVVSLISGGNIAMPLLGEILACAS